MTRLSLALLALVSSASFAQEIGTELTPATPTSAAQNPPPPPPPQASSQKPQANAPKQDASADRASVASGDFGIRANLLGSSAALAAGGTTGLSVAAPTIGFAFLTSDSFKLLVDVGVGFATANNSVALAFGVGAGFDYLFRTPSDALRPFIHVLASFTFGGQLSNPSLGLAVQGGAGAEYFFSRNFSVNGKLLLGVPMTLSPSFMLSILTVTPGVGATWYF